MVRKIIGKLTKPKVTFERHGNTYVLLAGTSALFWRNSPFYPYRRIKQNFFGAWVEVDQYLKLGFELIPEQQKEKGNES